MTLEIALIIVGFLIMIVGCVSGITGIWLTIKYYRFNRRENSLGLTGMEIARKILDDNGKIDLTKFSPITYDPVHHTIEHSFHSRPLCIFLQELLIPDFVLIVNRWHMVSYF